MSNVATLDNKVNDMILGGRALEAFEELYADDVVMQENNEEPRAGKAVNRKFEQDFFASIDKWNDGKLLASAVNGDTTFSEWHMDVNMKSGYHYKSTQVAVRKWKDGKIVHERFFYNKG